MAIASTHRAHWTAAQIWLASSSRTSSAVVSSLAEMFETIGGFGSRNSSEELKRDSSFEASRISGQCIHVNSGSRYS